MSSAGERFGVLQTDSPWGKIHFIELGVVDLRLNEKKSIAMANSIRATRLLPAHFLEKDKRIVFLFLSEERFLSTFLENIKKNKKKRDTNITS